MNINESKMKEKGEDRVWNTIRSKNGKTKDISSTQLGQQIILDESLRIIDKVRYWIDKESANIYRKELKAYFSDDGILLEKITQSFLLLAGSINITEGKQAKKVNRHKRINTLKTKVMPELSFDLIWRFIEVIIKLSKYFDTESVLTFTSQDKWERKVKYTCSLSEEIMEKLTIKAAEAFYSMPMTTVPVDWSWTKELGIKGGYETFQHEMVRTPNVDYSLYSQGIFDSANYIQSTPWTINKEVLAQVIKDLKAPLRTDYILSAYPDMESSKWGIDLKECELSEKEIAHIELERKKFKDLVSIYNSEVSDFESEMGKYIAVKMATQIADKFKDEEVIYFPHNYDFRGRIYPIAVGLSPQGSDAIKAMLKYKNGEQLDREGAEQAFAYLASLYGDDKLPYLKRIERGMELLDADYKEADEPYQFLAHQIEMKKVVEDPDTLFYGRIHLDACNSGSQFTSAITGDKSGCEATNVIPSFDENGESVRKDAYLLVAEKALELSIERINENVGKPIEEEFRFFKSLLETDGRKICKTPVMVSNYGGTAGGRASILFETMRELKVDRKWINKKTSANFAKVIGDSISGVLNGGKAFEKYIHKMNNAIAKTNDPITWTTSDGFFVKHVKNKELKAKQVVCMLPGGRKKTKIIKKVYSDNISVAKMRSAISPNYIHSLDAELLRRTAMKMKEAGILDSDWIHDSFGCHPNHVALMLKITKIEFLNMMKENPLGALDSELRAQMKSTKKKDIDVLGKIQIPNLGGIQNGDLERVMESEWFFS